MSMLIFLTLGFKIYIHHIFYFITFPVEPHLPHPTFSLEVEWRPVSFSLRFWNDGSSGKLNDGTDPGN